MSKSSLDSLQVEVKEALFETETRYETPYQNETTSQQLVFNFKIQKIVDQDFVKSLANTIDGAEDMLKAFFGANIFVSLFSSGFLQFLWGMINTLQVLVLTELFYIDIPVNADMVMRMILRMCSLDFIQTDKIFEVFKFRETKTFHTETSEAGEETSKWAEAGYDSSNFFLLMGAIVIFMALFVVISVFKLTIRACTSCCGNNFFTRYFRKPIMFTVIGLRFLLEGCIEIGLSAMITVMMMDGDNFKSFWEGVSTLSAFLSLVCLAIAPAALIFVTRKYLKDFEATKDAE